VGCGCSNNTNNVNPNNTGLSGNWQMTLHHNSKTETQSGFLLQSGNVLGGSVLFSGQSISGQTVCSGVGSVLGQANGGTVTIAVTQAGQSTSLTGAAASDFSSMNGNYSILAAGCGKTETGTWTATRVTPLTGTFSAQFTSTESGNQVFHVTGALTQGGNKGNSFANLSGTMTSTDAPCFTSASMTGVISGTAVILNISNSSGPLGTYSGTAATDASQITGSYTFSNTQSQSGCNDMGTADFTVNPSSG
jgi:hypothetical protein